MTTDQKIIRDEKFVPILDKNLDLTNIYMWLNFALDKSQETNPLQCPLYSRTKKNTLFTLQQRKQIAHPSLPSFRALIRLIMLRTMKHVASCNLLSSRAGNSTPLEINVKVSIESIECKGLFCCNLTIC
jgi:hypothetical protein